MKVKQAVILCGGMGTRLGQLTKNTPKPLLTVCGRPFLDILISELGRQGIREIILLAGFCSEQIDYYVSTSDIASYLGLKLRVSKEALPAGTGGALRLAAEFLASEFLLLNGDSWFDINLCDLIPSSRHSDPNWLVVMALRQIADASRYGVVSLEGDLVTSMAECPSACGPALVNGGVYLMRRDILDIIPSACSLERDVLPLLFAVGRALGRQHNGYFIDIGIPADYERAQLEIPAKLNGRPIKAIDS